MTAPIISLAWFRKREPLTEKATDHRDTPALVVKLSPETASKVLAVGIVNAGVSK